MTDERHEIVNVNRGEYEVGREGKLSRSLQTSKTVMSKTSWLSDRELRASNPKINKKTKVESQKPREKGSC